jgi:uncharacterized protein (DUF58 family)
LIKLKSFDNNIFRHKKSQTDALYASTNDLLNMRRYVSFIRQGRRNTSSLDSGDIKSAFKGRGIEMEEIREYQFGDDTRDIDWRVTARKSTPYTKIYNVERNREMYVWLDLSPIMMFGSKIELKAVTGAKVAALLGWIALANKDKFGCVIFDGKKSWVFEPKHDSSYISSICKKISQINHDSLDNLTDDNEERLKSLRLLKKQAKKGNGVFIISSFLFWGEEYDGELAYLAKGKKMFLINIFDVLEKKPPISGQYMASFGNEQIVFDTSSKNYRKNYINYFENIHKSREDWCKKFGCQMIDFSQQSSFINGLKFI